MRFRISVLATAAILFGFALAFSPRLSSQAPQRAGEVSRLIPAVNIDRGDQRLVAEAQAPVFWRDVVATQRLARARIALEDGSILNVGSNSSLRIIQHDAQAQQTELQLNFGRVRAKVAHLAHPGAKFEIHTPVATAGVVGTDFFLQQGEGGAPPSGKIDVAILPFAAVPGTSASQANSEALAKQLSDGIAQSGRTSAAVIAPPAGASEPLSPQDAAQAGQATNASLVLLPTIQQAQAKEIQQGFGGFGRFHIPVVGGGNLKHVGTEVQLQVQVIRSADGVKLDSLNADSKKNFNKVNVDLAGYSTDLGSADVDNPDFQKSPLGQTLQNAMAKLVALVQSQTAKALQQASTAASPSAAFHNDVATVLDFEGSVRFCNLKQQCVSVGPGMMSTIRDGQPPDPPHPAPQSVIQDAEQSTEVGPATPPAPVQTASAPPPIAPEATGAAPVLPSGPAPPCGPPSATGSSVFAKGAQRATGNLANWNFLLRPFSATMVATAKSRVTQMKYYVTGGAIRMETEQNGKQSIVIMRTDCGLMWTIMPQQKMYMEIDFGAFKSLAKGLGGTPGGSNVTNAVRMPDAKFTREKIGTEQLGPYFCDKYRFTVISESKTYSGVMWAARQLNGFPVKWLDERTGNTIEYRDIDLGPQNPSLFEPPAGYRKMTMPGFGH